MKTKPNRSQRKHTRNATRRRQSLKARLKTSKPLGVMIQPQQPNPQGTSTRPSPLELVCANAEVCCGGLNLVRSTVSDQEGSYLVMSIEVPVHFTVAYDAWTRFEDLPHFMRGMGRLDSHDGSRMTWRIRTLFDQFAWQAKVCEQLPFELISWKSVQGTPHPGFGSVSFEPISHLRSWIMVQVAFDTSGVYRWLGDPLPWLSQSLEQSLKRFHHSVAFAPAEGTEPQSSCLVHAPS